MSQSSTPAVTDAIYDASSLGRPRMFLLGLQHLFAMFGATVLVPVVTGLSVSATLLFAGLGTLLFHFLSRDKVPAFLGSSFAFIAGYAAIAPNGEAELLPYACLGVACAGLLYPVLAALFRAFGAKRVMRFFPPVVTGPIVISIGLILASSAIANCQANWLVAIIAVAVIVICNIWGRGMVKIVPILLGVVVLSVFFYRPFCKWLCPLGAFYGMCNKVSAYRLEVNESKCTSCGACSRVCKMDVEVFHIPNHAECIRCGDCVATCPQQAITKTFALKRQTKKKETVT